MFSLYVYNALIFLVFAMLIFACLESGTVIDKKNFQRLLLLQCQKYAWFFIDIALLTQ